MTNWRPICIPEVGHLPIIKDVAKKIKLVESLDAMVDSQMDLKPGVTVLAMVLDIWMKQKAKLPAGENGLPNGRLLLDGFAVDHKASGLCCFI